MDLCVPNNDVVSKFFGVLEAVRCKTNATTSKKGDTFVKVCKMHKLHHDQFRLYKRWLIYLLFVPEADLLVDDNCAFKPSGPRWKHILQEGSR